jgi:2-dehydro-3-deoxyphosphooctonate aldolase (KDO 8-P synthase)
LTVFRNWKKIENLEKFRDFSRSTVTNIHTNEDADMATQYVDVLQIPAFLVP